HHPRVVAAGTEGRSERHLAVPRGQAISLGIGDGSPAYGPGLITGLRRAGILSHRMPEMYRRPVAALTDDVGVNIAILRGSLQCLVRWAGRRGPWSMRVRVKMVARGGWRAWDRLGLGGARRRWGVGRRRFNASGVLRSGRALHLGECVVVRWGNGVGGHDALFLAGDGFVEFVKHIGFGQRLIPLPALVATGIIQPIWIGDQK